jgi:ABC-2 type transport system permease protein
VRALLKLTWVELKLFLREPTTLVFTFAFPVVILFVMGEIFGERQGHPGEVMFRGFEPLDYYVPAYMALVTASVGVIMLPARLTAYRAGGVLRRFRASLVPVWAVLGSQMLAASVLGGIGSVLVWAFGEIVYDVRAPAAPGAVVVAFLASAFAFAAIGALLGAVMPSTRAAQGAGLMLFFVMLFVSGTGPPVEVMSGTMLRIGDLLPLTYAVEALQDAWNGLGWNWADLAVLGGVTVVAGWVALRVYRWG